MSEKFCGACGAALSGGKFCSKCGKPVGSQPAPTAQPASGAPQALPVDATIVRPIGSDSPVASPPVVPPAPPTDQVPPPVPPAPAQPATVQPAAAGAAQPTTGASLFAGLSSADLVRDAISAVASFTALGVVWTSGRDGGDYWWVVISVLLSVASLTVPYLHQAKLLGSLGASEARLIKLAANVPALISIVVAIINALINLDDDYFAGGIGGGVVMLTAGAVLAMQPRASEEAPAHVAGLWQKASFIVGAAAAVVAIVTTLCYLIFTDGVWDPVLGTIAYVLLIAGGFAIVFVFPLIKAVGRSFAGTAVLLTTGVTVVAGELLSHMGDSSAFGLSISSLRELVWPATFLVVATGAIFFSRPVLGQINRKSDVDDWVETARLGLGLAAVYGALFVVTLIVGMAANDGWSGSNITLVVMIVVASAAAAMATNLMSTDPSANRTRAVVVAGAGLLVAIVAIAVSRSNDDGIGQLDWLVTSGLFGFPILAICALTIPKSVRTQFGPIYTPPAEPQAPVA